LQDQKSLKIFGKVLALDIGFGHFTAELILELLRRGLHKVGGWSVEWTGESAVESELHAADGIDHHTGGVG
jgi:hypothetical protein